VAYFLVEVAGTVLRVGDSSVPQKSNHGGIIVEEKGFEQVVSFFPAAEQVQT
jgi:hypothetical protein